MANKGKPSEGDQDKPLEKPGEALPGEEREAGDLAEALAAQAEATAAEAAEAAAAPEAPEVLGAGEYFGATEAPPGVGDAESAEFAANAWALNQFLQILRGGGPIPITFQPGSQTKEFEKKGELNDRLVGKRPVPLPRGPESCLRPASVAFPPCSDMLLALPTLSGSGAGDEIVGFFKDYFRYCDHTILIGDSKLDGLLDGGLLDCTEKWTENLSASPCNPPIIESAPISAAADTCADYPYNQPFPSRWPPPHCLPPSCVTLSGTRHLYPDSIPAPDGKIRRLFIADLVWLFYFERLGIFQILGRILDEYAYRGNIPISNGTIHADVRDDVIALVLEAMVRQTEAGTSSKVRDRDSSFRRCLGWTSDAGKKLGAPSSVNTGFNTLFHRFIANALDFYQDKRLAVAIRSTATPTAQPSVSTLVTIGDTLSLLKKTFDSFDYGRNYYNTLNGIVWVIAGMALVRELRTTLGIPPEYEKPYEFIPAAYDILILNRPITPSDHNRYEAHRECANDGRDILLDIEVLNHQDIAVGGEVDIWLSSIEGKIEGYRAAYRTLTGIDLGKGYPASIDQQV